MVFIMNLYKLKVCLTYFHSRVNIYTYLHASILTSDSRKVSCCPASDSYMCCISSMPEQPVKALLNQNQSFLFNYPFMYLRHILTIIYQLMLHFKTVSEYFIMEI